MTKPTYCLSSRIQLNNGKSMPLIQLGVYMVDGKDQVDTAVKAALDAGYRGIDSAEWYGNEAEVGASIQSWLSHQSNHSRKDIYFTTKLRSNESYSATRAAIKGSIERSGLGYIDLYLLHSPYGGAKKRAECWRAVQDAVADGEVVSGGVSNFGVKHLEELPEPRPTVNQIELHPFHLQPAIVQTCQVHNIVVQAWAPLVRGLKMENHVVASLSKKYSCSPAQLLIRWSLQKGFAPVAKSVTPERIQLNGEIEDVEIEEGDVKRLDGLDEGLVTDWDPTDCE